MSSVSVGQSQQHQDRFKQRQTNFYTQTVDENAARLNTKTTFQDLLAEIKFIQSEMLVNHFESDGGDPVDGPAVSLADCDKPVRPEWNKPRIRQSKEG